MKITRRQLKRLILESTKPNHDMLEYYTDLITDHIFQALNDSNVKTHLEKIEASSVHSENLIPLRLHIAAEEIRKNHNMINDVVLEVGITDDGSLSTTGGYAANIKNRSMSDLIVTVLLPDPNWQESLGHDFKVFLQAELEELIRHELEHSTHENDLIKEPGDAKNKWDSLEHIFNNYASPTETKSHIAGFRRKLKFLNKSGYESSIDNIIQNYIQNVIFIPGIEYYNYSKEEMQKVCNKIYETWNRFIGEAD